MAVSRRPGREARHPRVQRVARRAAGVLLLPFMHGTFMHVYQHVSMTMVAPARDYILQKLQN